MKKAITQEHSMGCAVACTAYILNCTYQKALKYYKDPKHAWERGFYCREIVKALKKSGGDYTYKRLKTVKDEILKTPNTIVFIKKSKKYPEGHFLVRTRNANWMNPWMNFPFIAPAKGGFQKKLPGVPLYAIFVRHS